jgi:hypothetical protein
LTLWGMSRQHTIFHDGNSTLRLVIARHSRACGPLERSPSQAYRPLPPFNPQLGDFEPRHPWSDVHARRVVDILESQSARSGDGVYLQRSSVKLAGVVNADCIIARADPCRDVNLARKSTGWRCFGPACARLARLSTQHRLHSGHRITIDHADAVILVDLDDLTAAYSENFASSAAAPKLRVVMISGILDRLVPPYVAHDYARAMRRKQGPLIQLVDIPEPAISIP